MRKFMERFKCHAWHKVITRMSELTLVILCALTVLEGVGVFKKWVIN